MKTLIIVPKPIDFIKVGGAAFTASASGNVVSSSCSCGCGGNGGGNACNCS